MKGLLILLASALLLGAAWVKRDSLGWPSGDAGEKMCSEVDIDVPVPHAVFRDYGENWSKLEKYNGQVVLVNFWATWCPPCVDERPTLIQLQEEYGTKGFTVIGIVMDDEGAQTVRPFVETRRFEVKGLARAINYPSGDARHGREIRRQRRVSVEFFDFTRWPPGETHCRTGVPPIDLQGHGYNQASLFDIAGAGIRR